MTNTNSPRRPAPRCTNCQLKGTKADPLFHVSFAGLRHRDCKNA